MKALRKPTRLVLVTSLVVVLVVAITGTTFSAFTSKAENTGNVIKAAPDWKAPTITAGVAATGALNHIRQGDSVYVYANVTDSGNPASGVASVTTDVTVTGYGAISIPMTAGTYNYRGQTYNYRSAAQAIPNPFADQTLALAITASDNAGNSESQNVTVYVENATPTATNVQTANRTGGTAGRAEQGDTITYTFSKAMDPYTFITGWNGSARNVTLRLNNVGGGDTVTVHDGATQIPLGTVSLANTGYVTGTVNFNNSSMTMSGSTLTITLGTQAGTTRTVTATGTARWTPSTAARDLAGNAMSGNYVNETGGADREF